MAANHGGPWRYDSFVPIIFAGAGLKPMEVYRRVETVDVARTLAAWLGVKPPSGNISRVLNRSSGSEATEIRKNDKGKNCEIRINCRRVRHDCVGQRRSGRRHSAAVCRRDRQGVGQPEYTAGKPEFQTAISQLQGRFAQCQRPSRVLVKYSSTACHCAASRSAVNKGRRFSPCRARLLRKPASFSARSSNWRS